MQAKTKNIRIIARLDVKGPNLVKGVRLDGLRALGSSENFAEFYYKNNVDEIFYQDVVASLYNRNNLFDIVEKTTKKVFVPVTVSGGLRSLEDIEKSLRSGADKVALNTAAIKNPELINQAAAKFGSSTIIISIECIKNRDKYLAYTDNGREFTGKNVVNWAQEVEERGAGEILITSVDNDGTGNGFDDNLIKKIAQSVTIPIIAHGGAGKKEHLISAIDNGANALALASMLHYNALTNNNLKLNQNEMEGNFEYSKKNLTYKNFGIENILSIKQYLNNFKFQVRI